MTNILLCRAFIIIPLWFFLLYVSIILIARWISKKNISAKKKIVSVLVVFITILCGYFMFLHGGVRKTAIDLDKCISSFDDIVAMNLQKQNFPYWGSDSGEYYYAERSINNMQFQFHVIYGDMNSNFDVTATSSNGYEAILSPLFKCKKENNGVKCVASAMRAGKEEWFGVSAFNGNYRGTILLSKNDVNIVIDYEIKNEKKLFYCFTTEKPRNQGTVSVKT